jgi:hypothetical protein
MSNKKENEKQLQFCTADVKQAREQIILRDKYKNTDSEFPPKPNQRQRGHEGG